MIKVYPLFLLFFLISGCTNLSPKFQKRNPAQVENDTTIFSPSYIGSDVGTVRISMLNEETFRKINGRGWVLADGRCVSETCKANEDSDYFNLTSEIRIPDMRGKFLRMLNNGITNKDCRDLNQEENCFDMEDKRKMGSYQKDSINKHMHDLKVSKTANSTNNGHLAYATNSPVSNTHGGYMKNKGKGIKNETRPKNIAVNFFIKINED